LPAPLLPAEEAWNVILPSPASAAGTFDADRVYIPLQSGQLTALNRETGATAWSVELTSSWTPMIGGDGALFAANTRELIALRAATGDPLWRVTLDADLMVAPALQGNTVVVLLKPDQLRALRLSDGSEAWRRTIPVPSPSPAMAVDSSGVVVASGDRVSRIASDGQLEWERELEGVLSTPALSGDRVFVGSTDNYLYALETSTGRVVWRYGTGGDVVGAVADDRFVYFAALDNLLRALRRGSGNQVWKRDLSTRTTAPPSTFGGVVVVSGNNPALAAFNATTGDPIDKFELAGDVQGIPLVDTTLVPFHVAMIVITRDGRAIGLRPTRMMFREQPIAPLLTLPGRMLNREPFSLPNSQLPTPKLPN